VFLVSVVEPDADEAPALTRRLPLQPKTTFVRLDVLLVGHRPRMLFALLSAYLRSEAASSRLVTTMNPWPCAG
jgi:hypothetical protein